jgi:hypothetical protein
MEGYGTREVVRMLFNDAVRVAGAVHDQDGQIQPIIEEKYPTAAEYFDGNHQAVNLNKFSRKNCRGMKETRITAAIVT